MLKVSRILSAGVEGLRTLAREFLGEHPIGNTEGQCAAMAKQFADFLKQYHLQAKILDAREYKGPLTYVGQSNHVLAAVDGFYIDFTAKQFNPSADDVEIGQVSQLPQTWGVVNTYNSYQDFLTNFSKTQR